MSTTTTTSVIKKQIDVTGEVDMARYNPCKVHGCKPIVFRVYWGKNSSLIARCPADTTDNEAIFEGSFYKWNKFNPLPTFIERISQHIRELRQMGV